MPTLSYAIAFVSDMPRSVRFYRDVVGLKLRFESEHWSEFDTGATTLALHVAGDGPAASAGSTAAGGCHIGLGVEDLDAFHARLVAQGVRCVQPPKLEDFGGRLAKYLDPDGLGISVSGPPQR
jgi:lactoylglutathione lyase